MSNAQAAIRPATSPTLMKSSTFLWSGLDPLVRCARPYRAARQTDRTAGRTRGRAEPRLLPPDTHPGLRACPEATVSRDSRRASGPPADGPRILRGIARLLTPICRTESLDGGRLLLKVERGHPHHGEAGRLEALLAEVVRRVLGQLAMVLAVVLDHQSGHWLEQIGDAEESPPTSYTGTFTRRRGRPASRWHNMRSLDSGGEAVAGSNKDSASRSCAIPRRPGRFATYVASAGSVTRPEWSRQSPATTASTRPGARRSMSNAVLAPPVQGRP